VNPAAALDFAPVRLTTDGLTGRDGIGFWREVMGRQMLHVDIEPLRDGPFQLDAELRAMAGLRTMSCTSSPFRMQRTAEIVARSNDDLGVVVNLGEKALVRQRGREVSLGRGAAALISNAEPATFIHSGSRHIGVIVPRSALAPLASDVDEAAARLIPQHSEALRLLVIYLQAIQNENLALATAELLRVTATHVHELFALAIGATPDAAVLARGRGVRAARMRAIRADIAAHLANPGLSVVSVARRQRVTPRYVQLLFESEGTTFSQFLLEQRLVRARRMLDDPRYVHWNISAIAYEAGFGDLSHFNRSFRRRYGEPPSLVRGASRRVK
jgi:AraC-like DNA-binding protein